MTTLDERIPRYIEKIAKCDPFSGKVVTGGIVTARDSSWLMSWTANRQPHFKNQPDDQIVVWVYALYSDKPGDYTDKTIEEPTGEEITREWLYHLGVPVDEIDEMAATGAKNFAFIGQFAESSQRDCIFTTEYSVRTPMEAVYTLMGVERGVPEVFNSTFDVRTLLDATVQLRDGQALGSGRDTKAGRFMRKHFLDKIEDNEIGELLHEAGLLKPRS